MPATGPGALQLALVVVLACALVMGPIILLWQIDPLGPWRPMPLFALMVAIESVLTRRWLDWPVRRRQRSSISLAELAFLLALTPFFIWLATDHAPFAIEALSLLENPFTFFSPEIILYMLLALAIWVRARGWAGLFIQLAFNSHEIRYYAASPSEREADRSIILPPKNRQNLLNSFTSSWIAGGILLVTAAALTTIDLQTVPVAFSGSGGFRTLARLGLKQEMLIALLVYFVGGLWLISQGRIVVLQGRWLAGRSQLEPVLVNEWRRWGFIFLALLALFASLLPIGTTLPLFQIVGSIFSLLMRIAAGIFALLIFIGSMLISLLPGSNAASVPPPDFEQVLPPAAPLDGQTLHIPPVFAGAAFWLVVITISVLAAYYFLRERSPGILKVDLPRLIRRLLHWLLGLGHAVIENAAELVTPLQLRLGRFSEADKRPAPFGFFRINALPAREQIRFLYLSLIRNAAKKGMERGPGVTPGEFGQRLKAKLPESEGDINRLTSAFISARYSRQHIEQRSLTKAKDAWSRLRKVLAAFPRPPAS